MNTPTAALAWEFWARHHKRLLILGGMIVAFALFYPRLCASAGLNLAGPDILEDFGRKLSSLNHGGPATPGDILRVLYLLALAGGPILAMLLSMLFAVWMFTYTEMDAARNPMALPGRLFQLPVSTGFLARRLIGGGMLGIVVLYYAWTHLVRQPNCAPFGAFHNCFAWVTFLVLTQAAVWGLAGWPKTRALTLMGLLWGFISMPAWNRSSFWPWILAPLFLQGVIVAVAGLQNARSGQWQGRTFRRPFGELFQTRSRTTAVPFRSPFRAQLWYDWDRQGWPMFLGMAALAILPVAILAFLRSVFGWAPLDADELVGFTVCLAVVPGMAYLLASFSPTRSDPLFLMNRPMTSGRIALARLVVAAISVGLSWLAVLVAMQGLRLLGDFSAVEKKISPYPSQRWLLACLLIFLTWRFVAVALCFTSTGRRRLVEVPIWLWFAISLGGPLLSWFSNQPEYWDPFMRALPFLLGALIVVKLAVAVSSFRLSLKRNLISSSETAAAVVIWCLLVGIGLAAATTAFRLGSTPVHGCGLICMGVILLVPLARIGLCPLAFAMNRHGLGVAETLKELYY